MTVRTKDVSPELLALYEMSIAAFTKNISGVFPGGLTTVIVEREHYSPNIYFYSFCDHRSPLAEIGNNGTSLVFRPYSVKGRNGDVYLSEDAILREMTVLPGLIKDRVIEVQALDLGVNPEDVHKFTDPNYVPPQSKTGKKK